MTEGENDHGYCVAGFDFAVHSLGLVASNEVNASRVAGDSFFVLFRSCHGGIARETNLSNPVLTGNQENKESSTGTDNGKCERFDLPTGHHLSLHFSNLLLPQH
jgi:hypothetical protein